VEGRDKQDATITFSRVFVLVSSNDEDRQRQLEQIFQGFNDIFENSGDNYEVKMALRAATPVTDSGILGGSASGLGPVSSMGGSKAGYNPYMVGNDMGLWTPNKSWVIYVRDVLPEIENRLSSQDPRDYMVAGLALMALGQGAPALEYYDKAQKLAALQPHADAIRLLQLAGLGKGTAFVILGDDESAVKEYKNVAEINPQNEIALSNIKVLTRED
jgi:hypothetical protein